MLAFFRGKRLLEINPAIKVSGKFELGNLFFCEGSDVDHASIAKLGAVAAALNAELGDPTKALGKPNIFVAESERPTASRPADATS